MRIEGEEVNIPMSKGINVIIGDNRNHNKICIYFIKNIKIVRSKICPLCLFITFNFRLYEKLKEEENKDNCIKKVLPGIEFIKIIHKN